MIDTQFYSLSHSSRFLANNLIYVKESRAEVSKAKFRSRLLDRSRTLRMPQINVGEVEYVQGLAAIK